MVVSREGRGVKTYNLMGAAGALAAVAAVACRDGEGGGGDGEGDGAPEAGGFVLGWW